MAFTFNGGIHVAEHKNTRRCAIEVMPPPKTVSIPMSQHIGANAIPVVKVGDIVRCKVLEVNTEAKRISLSRKEALIEENPEIAEQLENERAERERQHQERQEQRAREREQQAAGNAQRQARSERASSDNGERRERSDRRRRNSEDGEYELPPVQSTTTSLADLFAAFKTEE